MDWAQVLVVILSLFLVVFLLAAITLVVMLIRVTHQIRQVTTAAQHAVSAFSRNTGRIQLAKAVVFASGRVSRMITKLKKDKRP